ncbi:MAG: Ig-like domain-containing protein, partial [Spirochaetota bacterium]
MKICRSTHFGRVALPLIAFLIGLSSCQLFFGSGTTVSVTSLALNKTTLLLEVGGTETLVATVAPAGATYKGLSWSSSASAIASVSQAGLVTALRVGSATVTATSKDGGFFQDCLVTVSPKTVVPGVTTSAPFWGHWVRMDQEEFWYIADSKVTQGS